MKKIVSVIIFLSVIFYQCSTYTEEYAKRPKVKFTRTQTWDYGDLKINVQYFFYGKNGLVEVIKTVDSVSKPVGIAGIKWFIYENSHKIMYNTRNNISEIIHTNGKQQIVEKFFYDEDVLQLRTRPDGNAIDTTIYNYNSDQIIRRYKVKDLLFKDYLTNGILDSTYISQGKYIISKKFFYHSDTLDYSKVPLSMGEKLFDPGNALVKFKTRGPGYSEEKLKYEFDLQKRPIKITINRCTDYSVTKVGYYD